MSQLKSIKQVSDYTEDFNSKQLAQVIKSEPHDPPTKHPTSKHVPSNASEHSDPHTEKPQCQHILPTKLEQRDPPTP